MIAFILLLAVAGSLAAPNGGKIVGGQDADIADFGHQVSIQRNGGHFCGGSIISDTYILSAAHCFKNPSTTGIEIVAGSTIWWDKPSSSQTIKAAQIIVHESYDPNTNDNDIAIIRLVSPLKLGNTVRKITLSTQDPGNGVTVTVTGWGTQTEGATTIPDKLQKVDVKMITRSACNMEYGYITPQMICAEASGKDSCQGDSGGPLIDKSNTLVGVVSFGRGCARPGYAGVYCSVAAMRAWIKQKTGL